LYQEELLRACGCQSVEELVPAIETMYETKPDELTPLLQKLMHLTNISEELSFYVLFSFDYFSYMHDYLIDPSTFQTLCDKIKV
jgi:coenzyme F420-reducing hydrogenase alpha subunit